MRGVLAEREARAREEMMSKVVSIFEALDDKKEKPERRRSRQKDCREPRPPDIGGANGERDR